MFHTITAIIIFLLAYIFIASEKLNKTIVSLLGAGLMITAHIISQHDAFHHIDMNVIFLLVSMMILVKIIEKTGIFQFLAIKFAKIVKGNPYYIMIILFFMTAIFSAILDNITTVLLISPISILIAHELRITPLPFLITQIFGSNIGGTATLIGDPPNIMIGSAAHLSFMDFIFNVFPIAFINLLIFSVIFYFIFRNKLEVTNENMARIMDFDEKKLIKDKKLLLKSTIVFSAVIIGFIIHGFVNLEAATISITGASILMLITGIDAEEIFKEVEWLTIFFFIGLFIMVGGLVETGIIKILSQKIMYVTKGDLELTSIIVLWFSGIASGIIDNIPFVATMIPLIQDMGNQLGMENVIPVWWSLSLGSCLGGNGTLIGASANIIVADFALKSGYKIKFLWFLKYSIGVTLLSLLISYVYIIFRYF